MNWRPLWHYHLVDFGRPLGDLNNITQRLHLLCTVSGDRLRIKLDNRHNQGDMSIQWIKLEADGHTVQATVAGKEGIVLRPGEIAHTDPVDIPVKPGMWLDVIVHFAAIGGVCALCQTWSAGTWQSEFYPEGDMSRPTESASLFPHLSMDAHKPTALFGVDNIDVMTDDSVRTVAMFGDSITHMSYYYDPLLRRLLESRPGGAVLANEGIGGNRLCHDPVFFKMMNAPATLFGPAGYKRFEEDLYTDMTPDVVLFLEGINDCSHGYQFGEPENVPDGEQFAHRLTQCVETAHRHGSRIYLATIMPASAFVKEEWQDKHEALRQEYNRWIRTQTIADGVIELDELMRDPSDVSGIQPALMMEDGLHPNQQGGEKMAGAVDIERILP